MHHVRTLALVLATTLLAASGAASAGGVATGVMMSNPAGACQAALPAFEGLIRKPAAGDAERGSASAFLSCAMVSSGGVLEVLLYVSAVDAPRTVSCTGVAGTNAGQAQYLTKTVQVAAGSQTLIRWRNTEFVDQDLGSRFSVSCALPPGTGVNDYALEWADY